MDFHKTRIWQTATTFEKIVGFWPFQNKIRNGIVCFLLFTLLHSFAIPMVARMLREWGQNVYIVVENLVTVMFIYGTSFKVSATYFYRGTRATIDKRIMNQLKKLNGEEELTIVKDYINYGFKFTLVYIALANLTTVVFDLPPLFKMIYSMIFSNGTTDKEFPYYVDYYGDNDKYFNCMVLHLTLTVLWTMVIVFAYDLSFVIMVQHASALFNIVTRRLKKASEVAEKYKTVKGISEECEREAHRLLITVIDIHEEALQTVILIDEAYRTVWFLKVMETVVEIGALLTVLTMLTKKLSDFIGYALYLAFMLIQFNVAFNRGQRLVDHMAAVFDACYDSPWENFSKESATLLRVIMIRSFKVNALTGGKVFTLTNETYMNMLKTAFSYFTVISSFINEDSTAQ